MVIGKENKTKDFGDGVIQRKTMEEATHGVQHPVCILVETSYKMKNYDKLITDAVKKILRLLNDHSGTDVMLMTYDDKPELFFHNAEEYPFDMNYYPDFECGGEAVLGLALNSALYYLDCRTDYLYKKTEFEYTAPSLILISSGYNQEGSVQRDFIGYNQKITADVKKEINRRRENGELDVLCLYVPAYNGRKILEDIAGKENCIDISNLYPLLPEIEPALKKITAAYDQ